MKPRTLDLSRTEGKWCSGPAGRNGLAQSSLCNRSTRHPWVMGSGGPGDQRGRWDSGKGRGLCSFLLLRGLLFTVYLLLWPPGPFFLCCLNHHLSQTLCGNPSSGRAALTSHPTLGSYLAGPEAQARLYSQRCTGPS